MRKALGFAIAAVMPFAMGGALLTRHNVTASPSDAPAAVVDDDASDVPVPRASRPPFDDENDEGNVDLFGNRVTDAVAKYKFDATGTLYESHSPQTELPRLAPPKT